MSAQNLNRFRRPVADAPVADVNQGPKEPKGPKGPKGPKEQYNEQVKILQEKQQMGPFNQLNVILQQTIEPRLALLEQYFESRYADQEKRFEARYADQEKRFEARYADQEKRLKAMIDEKQMHFKHSIENTIVSLLDTKNLSIL